MVRRSSALLALIILACTLLAAGAGVRGAAADRSDPPAGPTDADGGHPPTGPTDGGGDHHTHHFRTTARSGDGPVDDSSGDGTYADTPNNEVTVKTSTPTPVVELTNHGGPTVTSAAAYAIFWEPSGGSVYETAAAGDSSYESKIEAYFNNLNGSSFFHILGQYPSSAATASSTKYVAAYSDTRAFPEATLSDSDIHTEVSNVIASQGWPAGLGSIFFVFTPMNTKSCDDTACVYSAYCSYHGDFTSSKGVVLYVNMPDPGGAFASCGTPTAPSGDTYADAAINLVSHEYSEAISDPELNAWYDSSGNEVGDKCAWNYGSHPNGYDLTLTGVNYILQQEWSNSSSACALSYSPPPTAPAAPTAVTAVAGNALATVSWTAASNGGSAITSYKVASSPAGGVTGTVSGSATSTSVTGLTNGTNYTFTVTATNAVGTGPASAPSNSVKPAATAPAAPTGVKAVAGTGTATVSWTAASNGGSAITSYKVTSSPVGGVTGTISGSATSATVTGLTHGKSYTFTVTATNAIGTSPASSPSNSVKP